MKAQDNESRYWRSAAQPAAAVACTLIILIIIFLVLVLTPHQCGPEDEAILVEGPVEVVVRDTACTAGQGRDQGSVCVPCPLGTFNNGSFTFCQSCPIGFFADVEGSTQCTPCAPGIGLTTPDVGYPDGDCTCQRDYSSYAIPNGTCVTAPDTAKCLCRETDAGRQTTLDEYCDDGSDNSGCICLLSGEDDLWLVGDPSGNTRWRERGCIQCPRGKYKDTPSWDACLECSDPRIPSRMEVNGACICAPGYFKADDGGCPACPIGSYKRLASDEGSVACITCPPGTTTATAGTITLGECQCSQGFEGFFLQRGDGSSQLELQCRPCPPGYFKDTLGPQECQPCAPGTHAPTNATVQCRVCSPGEIAPAIGSQFCTLCLPGSYSPDPGGTVCEECIEDTFNLEYGASRCTQCLPNTFAAQGSARCSDCWQNYLGRSGVYLSRKGDTNLGYSVIPTMFLIIIALAFIFCLLLAYEAYRYLTGKRPPDGFVGDGEFRNIGVADIVPGGGAGMQPLVVPHQQPHPLQTLMQMSREQLYSVQKVEQEELGKDQARIRGNLEAMQQEAQAQLAQQPGATAEAQDELRLVHQTQTRQLEAFQALQMRSLQERHLKEQEHQMRAQQDQLDQQYHVQQREWEAYQSQRQADQQQQWDEFQRQIQLNQQQMAAVQPTNHQEPPAYYYPPGQAPLPPAPSMPRPQPPATLPAPPVMPGAQPAPVPGAGALYGSQVGMPAPPMPPNPYGSQVGMPAPPMPPNPYGSQVGMAPAPGMPMPMPQPLYGSQIGVPPGAMQGPVGFQPSAPSVQGSVYGPAPSAFSQPTPPPPVPMPPTQQAPPPQPPQTGPTDEHWQQILRQVDNM